MICPRCWSVMCYQPYERGVSLAHWFCPVCDTVVDPFDDDGVRRGWSPVAGGPHFLGGVAD
jgi:hypothetical protein